MNESLKKLGVIVGISLMLFWVIKPKTGKGGLFSFNKRVPIRRPSLSPEELQDPQISDAYTALCAYIDASNEGESETVLQEIKDGFKQKLGVDIYTDSNGKLAVKDLDGQDILVNG